MPNSKGPHRSYGRRSRALVPISFLVLMLSWEVPYVPDRTADLWGRWIPWEIKIWTRKTSKSPAFGAVYYYDLRRRNAGEDLRGPLGHHTFCGSTTPFQSSANSFRSFLEIPRPSRPNTLHEIPNEKKASIKPDQGWKTMALQQL